MDFHRLATVGPKPPWLRWFILIAFATGLTRLAMGHRSVFDSGFFYIGIPFIVGCAIYVLVPPPERTTRLKSFAYHIRTTLIVMLASSMLLFEGWLCILFALPIYLLGASLFFYASSPAGTRRGVKITIVPLVVAVASFEGLAYDFNGAHSVTRTQTVPASVEAIKARLAEPVVLHDTRPAFLGLFPLPHTVEAGSLQKGDVHSTHYTYKRWPIGNTHHGSMSIRIAEVGERHVVTETLSNDAYFSHYLTIEGTRIDFLPNDDGTTQVSLTIDYRRDLAPAWYFGPLQRLAMLQSADYLITDMMVPESGSETT